MIIYINNKIKFHFKGIIIALQWIPSEAQRGCPTNCTANLAPVCGKDNRGHYKTFSNNCKLSVAACQQPRRGTILQRFELKYNYLSYFFLISIF